MEQNKKRASGKRSKKRRFHGNQFSSKTKISSVSLKDKESFNVSSDCEVSTPDIDNNNV